EAFRKRGDAKDGVGRDLVLAAGFAHAIGADRRDAAVLHHRDGETDKIRRLRDLVEFGFKPDKPERFFGELGVRGRSGEADGERSEQCGKLHVPNLMRPAGVPSADLGRPPIFLSNVNAELGGILSLRWAGLFVMVPPAQWLSWKASGSLRGSTVRRLRRY